MFVLTVRGTHTQANTNAAIKLHNDTAGSEQGMAAARSFGDLSHKVYVKDSELLFLDVWQDPAQLQAFFSNPEVQQQAGKLFSKRDAAVWVMATNAFSFNLPAPTARPQRYVGIIRTEVTSQEAAIAAFRATGEKHLRDARKAGQLQHAIFFRIDNPNELLGIDVWTDRTAMEQHYGKIMPEFANVFAGKPDGTIWSEGGNFNEW